MRGIMGDEVGDKTAAVRALMPYAEKAAVLLKKLPLETIVRKPWRGL